MKRAACLLFLVYAAPAMSDELSGQYARAEGGLTVVTLFGGGRIGRVLSNPAIAVDVGLGGGQRFAMLTGALEVRLAPRKIVTPYLRGEVGGMIIRRGGSSLTATVGAGLAVRIDRRWTVRGGFSRGLRHADGVRGPDSIQVGLEYRW